MQKSGKQRVMYQKGKSYLNIFWKFIFKTWARICSRYCANVEEQKKTSLNKKEGTENFPRNLFFKFPKSRSERENSKK